MGSITVALQLSDYVIDETRREGCRLVLHVHAKNRRRPGCPYCSHCKPWRHGQRVRRVSHIPVGQTPCDLIITTPRYRCPECGGAFTPEQPGVARRARLSNDLRDFVHFQVSSLGVVLDKLQSWLRISWNTLLRCLRQPEPPDLARLRHVCLDEVYYREPRRFLTVLSDAETGRALDTAEGRGYTPSRSVLMALPVAVREQIETLATDLNSGQRKAAYDCLPDAAICADLFHVVRLAKQAIRDADPADRELVRQAVRRLLVILRTKDVTGFQQWLRVRQDSAGTLRRLHSTLTKWEIEIENYLETGRSTGPAEALNRKIALLRRKACGYTNLKNFIQRIRLLNDSLHPKV